MGQPVIHFEISGRDGKKLQRFYAAQFGWKINDKNPMRYGVVNTAAPAKSRGINGGIYSSQPGAPPSAVTIYVSVPKIDPALKKILKAGGKTIVPRTVIPGMVTFAQFSDPAGNVLGLVEDQMPPAAPAKKAPKKAAKRAAPKKAPKKRRR